MTSFILASASARRIMILKKYGFKFKAIPANIDEEKYINLNPIKMVKKLSLLKAEKISKQHKNEIVLGADTTVVLGNEMIGKPKNLSEAGRILSKLSGSTHTVLTGFAIINPLTKTKNTSFESTKVTFKPLSNKEINDYIKNYNVLDFAGSYAIQEGAEGFVEEYEGDYLNIVGLPFKAIKELEKVLNCDYGNSFY